MIPSEVDHIVIGAARLDQGVSYVQEILGVRVPPGGEHPAMGTHNRVMSLGDDCYLEIIAVNPDSPAPSRARWFGLDDPVLQKQLAVQPRLLAWVVRVPDLSAVTTLGYFGEILTMTRGNLQWMITVPGDGSLSGNGCLPLIIQWQTGSHPSRAMADLGCSLVRLDIFHPYSRRLIKNLESLDADRLVNLHPIEDNEPPGLTAHIQTPGGEVKVLSSVWPARG